MLLEANQRAASGGSIRMNPVTLPPGHATPATKPPPIGSATKVETIGTSGLPVAGPPMPAYQRAGRFLEGAY